MSRSDTNDPRPRSSADVPARAPCPPHIARFISPHNPRHRALPTHTRRGKPGRRRGEDAKTRRRHIPGPVPRRRSHGGTRLSHERFIDRYGDGPALLSASGPCVCFFSPGRGCHTRARGLPGTSLPTRRRTSVVYAKEPAPRAPQHRARPPHTRVGRRLEDEGGPRIRAFKGAKASHMPSRALDWAMSVPWTDSATNLRCCCAAESGDSLSFPPCRVGGERGRGRAGLPLPSSASVVASATLLLPPRIVADGPGRESPG